MKKPLQMRAEYTVSKYYDSAHFISHCSSFRQTVIDVVAQITGNLDQQRLASDVVSTGLSSPDMLSFLLTVQYENFLVTRLCYSHVFSFKGKRLLSKLPWKLVEVEETKKLIEG